MKICSTYGCKKYPSYFWNTPSQKLDLCLEHYEAMERAVHAKEKAQRLANLTIGIVAGTEYAITKCPNGKGCKYCKEINL